MLAKALQIASPKVNATEPPGLRGLLSRLSEDSEGEEKTEPCPSPLGQGFFGIPDIEVRIAQLGLTFHDINPGGVDGVFGKNSRKAMQRFQATEGLPTTDDLNDNVLDAIVRKCWGSL